MVGVCVAAIGVVGCAASVGNDGGTDTNADTARAPPATYDYVVSALTIDDSDAFEIAHTGFNIDGLFSGPTDADGCNHEDYFSLHDRDQHRPTGCAMGSAGCTEGVDNQLPTIINSVQAAVMNRDLRMLIADDLRAGSLTILVRVSDVDDLENDPAVNVRIWQAYPEFSDCGTAFSGSAEYSVSTASLRAGGTNIDTDASFNFPGAIVGGRLIVSTETGTLRVPLPEIMGVRINFDLLRAQVRLSLSADGMRGTDGDIGGYVDGNVFAAAFTRLGTDIGGVRDSILLGVIDIRLPGMTTYVDRSNPMGPQFGGISVGMGLSTVRARIRPTAAQARTPGTCGAQSTDGGRG